MNAQSFRTSARGSAWLAASTFALLLVAFVAIARSFHVIDSIQPHFTAAVCSFALVLLPYWCFGFGAAEPMRRWRWLSAPPGRWLASALLVVPYLVFVLPFHTFTWTMLGALLGMILAITGILELEQDAVALVLLAAAVELPFFRDAWPAPGLSGMSKLLFVDVGLYGFLVVRPIGGVGFDWRPRLRDVAIGLREFAFFVPLALGIGFALGFLHYHPSGFPALRFAAAWVFTLFFVAMPEEIFFRGLILNLLARRLGDRRALVVTALVFGLAHFPKRAVFNWRYVILAAIAGIFYGRAWLDRRRLLCSGITHATVDAVWSIWLR